MSKVQVRKQASHYWNYAITSIVVLVIIFAVALVIATYFDVGDTIKRVLLGTPPALFALIILGTYTRIKASKASRPKKCGKCGHLLVLVETDNKIGFICTNDNDHCERAGDWDYAKSVAE